MFFMFEFSNKVSIFWSLSSFSPFLTQAFPIFNCKVTLQLNKALSKHSWLAPVISTIFLN